MPVYDVPAVEKIDSIASLEDPALRNLLITQCYFELSSVFARRMGTGANWCTFATWASKQAGQTIRRQDLERILENFLKNEPEINAACTLLATLAKGSGALQSFEQLRDSAMGVMVARMAGHAADEVSRGNKKVFEEIAREFSRFITGYLDDTVYERSHMDAFIAQLKPGLPPQGQDYLARGFSSYYQAFFEKDMQKKAQLNLLGNLWIGYHEQNRLQPEIAGALTISVNSQQVKKDLLDKLFAGSGWWTKIRIFLQRIFGSTPLDKAIEAFVELIQLRVRKVLTAHLMTITLPPDNCLQLGRDISMPYPAHLSELSNADLLALLSRIDPTPDSVFESGATDWANLPERMHYIADMFRCYHQSSELFDAAFTEAQIEAMKSGKLPEGRL